MESFGEYITKEYGILRKILGYLTFRDLLIARKVCRDWLIVVNRILLNKITNIPEVHFAKHPPNIKKEEMFWNNMISVPEVLIKFYSCELYQKFSALSDLKTLWLPVFDCDFHIGSDVEDEEALEKCIEESSFKMVSPVILHCCCEDTFTYSSKDRKEPKVFRHSSFHVAGGSSTITFPRVSGVHYSVFSFSLKDHDGSHYKLDELQMNQDKGPVRCILIFENISRNYRPRLLKFLQFIFETLNEQQSTQFAFGGGKVNRIYSWDREKRNNPQICGVILRGENVMATSDIMEYNYSPENMDTFFESLAENVGTLPEGASRVALMAQCIDRPRTIKDENESLDVEAEVIEMHHFAKHFPDVPIIGFLAGGEFGIKGASHESIDSHESPKKPRKNVFGVGEDLMHWQSTSIVVLTYLKPPK